MKFGLPRISGERLIKQLFAPLELALWVRGKLIARGRELSLASQRTPTGFETVAVQHEIDLFPLHRTYVTPASILATAAAQIDVSSMLASFYINLGSAGLNDARGRFPAYFAPNFRPEHFGEMGFFQHEGWSNAFSKFDGTFIQWIAESLLEGWFLRVEVNRFHMPYSSDYHRLNHDHYCLVIGCDLAKYELTVVDYTTAGQFSKAVISIRDLLLGMKYARRIGPPSQHTIARFRPVKGQKNIFQASDAVYLLKCYLSSSCTGNTACPWNFTRISKSAWEHAELCSGYGDVFGIAAFGAMVRYMESQLRSCKPIDLRVTRVLYEHKAIMARNLKFWYARAGQCGFESVSPFFSYVNVEKWAHSVHYAACDLLRDRGNAQRVSQLKRLLQQFPEIQTQEVTMMTNALEMLEALSDLDQRGAGNRG